MDKPVTPTLDKLIDNTRTFNAIFQFLEWLGEDTHYHVAEYGTENIPCPQLWHTHKSPEDLIYEYLEIDPKLLDQEREAILNYVREAHVGKETPVVTMAVITGDEKEII